MIEMQKISTLLRCFYSREIALHFASMRGRKPYVHERLLFGLSSRATGWEFNVHKSETKC